MIDRAIPLLLALTGCLSAPPRSLGDGGPPPDAAPPMPIACEDPGDCPAELDATTCHCGSCARPDTDCVGLIRYVEADGSDGDCVPMPSRLALGQQSSCVLWSNGLVSCWGDDCYGELGDGEGGDCSDGPKFSVVPTLVRESSGGPPFGGVIALSAGVHQVCAVRLDGSVWCWGSNEHGKLGDGSDSSIAPTPVEVVDAARDPLADLTAVAAGSDHACALDGDGNVYCWGDNGYKQLGVTGVAERNRAAPIDAPPGFKGLASGGWHSCAARPDNPSSELFCWGRGTHGQLGYGGTLEGSAAALLVAHEESLETPLAATVFALGENFGCSGEFAEAARCWGSNLGHALGDELAPSGQSGVDAYATRPIAFDPPANVIRVAAGGDFAFMIFNDGTLIGWGQNAVGQLGLGSASATPLPPTEIALDAIEIEAGCDHACAITEEQTVVCWGGNDQGQLGDGGAESRATPAEVIELCP